MRTVRIRNQYRELIVHHDVSVTAITFGSEMERSGGMRKAANTLLISALVVIGPQSMISQNYLGSIRLAILVAVIAIAWFAIIWFTSPGPKPLSSKTTLIATAFLFNIALTALLRQDASRANLLLIFMVIISVIATANIPILEFEQLYVTVMSALAGYSLITTYLLKYSLFAQLLPVSVNPEGYSFFNFGLSFVLNHDDYWRNFGVFTEPGMFATYLIPALFYALAHDGRQDRRHGSTARILILTMAMISTLSPVGIISAIAMLVIFLFGWVRSVTKLFATSIPIIFATSLVLGNPVWAEAIFEAVAKVDSSGGSFRAREYSFEENIELWFNHPLFGNGISGTYLNMLEQGASGFTYHNTNTPTFVLAAFGLFFFVIYMLLLWAAFYRRPRLLSLVGFGFFVVAISNQNVLTSYIIWMLVFYGAQKLTNPTRRLRRSVSTTVLHSHLV